MVLSYLTGTKLSKKFTIPRMKMKPNINPAGELKKASMFRVI